MKNNSIQLKKNDETAQIASTLDQYINVYAFRFFNDFTFRSLTDFPQRTQEDSDRIFNEIVVSYLLLMSLALEAVSKSIDLDQQEQLFAVRDMLPATHVSYLAELGIPKKFLNMWTQLIEMREQEAVQDKERIRKEAVEVHGKKKTLTVEDHLGIEITLPIHTVAINLHHHILKGKIDGPNSDALFLCIFKKMSEAYIDYQMVIKFGKINIWQKLWSKAFAKWKMFWKKED